MLMLTPIVPHRWMKQGDLQLGVYDVNQQRLINNGGSVSIGDRLFIEIKYRTGYLTCGCYSSMLFLNTIVK
jgi:hypothetical protein